MNLDTCNLMTIPAEFIFYLGDIGSRKLLGSVDVFICVKLNNHVFYFSNDDYDFSNGIRLQDLFARVFGLWA
jgi:hypothetical protein